MISSAGSAPGDSRQPPPQHRQPALPPLHARVVAGVEMHVRDQHWQQHQVGENDDRHADARGDGHLADHLHRNHEDGDETDQVGKQRYHRRRQQLAECAARRLHAVESANAHRSRR